jgi:hypothetical protein
MNDTPRTDAIEPQCEIRTGGCEDWCCPDFPCPTCKGNAAVAVALDHARQLEIELSEANQTIEFMTAWLLINRPDVYDSMNETIQRLQAKEKK